jgi:hypothetical protein
MKNKIFLRYIFGIIGISVLVGSLIVFQDFTSSYKTAKGSELMADKYAVGLEYPGVITKNFVHLGDHVQKDQVLATVRSSILIEALTQAKININDLNYPLNSAGEVVLRATKDGTISDINFSEGSFIAGNKEVFDIIDDSSRYILSTTIVSPNDLKLLSNNRHILATLYNGQVIDLKIRQITIKQAGNQYVATITSVPVSQGILNNLALGSPIPTRLVLKDKNLYAILTDQSHSLYIKLAHK